MNKLYISIITLLLAGSFNAGAQSAAEIAAAKSMARAYGYSDAEIDNVLNSRISSSATSTNSRKNNYNGNNYNGNNYNGNNYNGNNYNGNNYNGNNYNGNENNNGYGNYYGNTPNTLRRNAGASGYRSRSANARVRNGALPDGMIMMPDGTMVPDTTMEYFPYEEDFFRMENPDSAKTKEIFGHNYFNSMGLSVIPSYNAPAPASYVLGPGDEVIINVWGATNSNITATVDNDGSISVLDLGPVYVSGMNLKNAETFLKEQFSRIYSGLGGENGDTWLRLSIGKIKGVVVNVIGEVNVPGAYTIPSLCSITSAIFMAGGVSDVASVRSIYLNRNGRRISTFDLYDFIFHGKFDENMRLQDGDIIYVAPYSSVVSIGGAVTRPMRYEVVEKDNVGKLLEYAGGFTTGAQRDEVHLIRRDVKTGQAYDIKSSDFESFKLKDGDVVSVRGNDEVLSNTVNIKGPVIYPGDYAVSGTVSDVAALVKAAGGLREGAYTGRGQIKRLDGNRLPAFISFDLAKVINGEEKVALMRQDSVTLFTKDELYEKHLISVSGHVGTPGFYHYYDGMTVADAILLAKGVRDDAFTERGQIRRINVDGVPENIPFNIKAALDGSGNVPLYHGDDVRIYSANELMPEAGVTINGEVKKDTTVVFRNGFTLGDLIMIAGGFRSGADISNIEVSSRGGKTRGEVRTVNLEENPESRNLPLKPYDIVSIRRLTYFRPQTAVTVNGEVLHPGTYVIDKPQVRLSDVMSKIGGFTEEAFVHGSRLKRVLTQDEMIRQEEAVAIAKQNMTKNDTLTIKLVDHYYIGIDLEKALANPGSDDDIVLRAGDVLDVPAFNNTVTISGGVFMPNTVTYVAGMTWRQYIDQAGGFTKLARRGKTYVMYMNGKATVRGSGMKIEPGCEIVVPVRRENNNRMSVAEIAALTTTVTSLGTLATTIAKLL